MKTPLQEFEDWFKENRSSALSHDILRKIKELLPKEKEVIYHSFYAGIGAGTPPINDKSWEEQFNNYLNQTFNTDL